MLALLPPPQAEATTAAIAMSIITPANFMLFIVASLRFIVFFADAIRFGNRLIIKLRLWQVGVALTALWSHLRQQPP